MIEPFSNELSIILNEKFDSTIYRSLYHQVFMVIHRMVANVRLASAIVIR